MTPPTPWTRTLWTRSLLAAAILSLTLPAFATTRWIEVRSPHFRVLSDGSSNDARAAAFQFEQMRYVFESRFPGFQLESGAPLTIVAARDEQTAKDLDGPRMWKSMGSKVAGYFQNGWERRFALVRLDTFTAGKEVVYHEYTHSVLHANMHWLPMWLDEGIAEFYAYTRFEDKRTLLGAPTQRYPVLERSTLIPIREMLDINGRSAIYKDEQRMQLFYAESWALIHYMIFGPEMEGGKKLSQFVHLLDTHTDQQTAFVKTFGDPAAFDRGLDNYLHHFTLQAGIVPTNPAINKAAFAERTLSPAETAYELGAFHVGNHDIAGGRPLIEKALQLDPNLGAAHEDLGFLDFAEGRDKARAEWLKAFTLDPTLYRSLFAETMSGTPLREQAPEQLKLTRLALQKVAQTNRRFAPAYVEIAMIALREGDLSLALSASRQAEALEPWRSGYHILTGRILLAQGKGATAATFARYVADHWYGPDHDEAVDLWNDIPAADRGSEPPPSLSLAPGLKSVAGTLTSVGCSGTGKDHKDMITLKPDGTGAQTPLTFDASHAAIGFTDTFWWGEDHFSPCHHLNGDHAIAIFKPHGDMGGDLGMIEIRDDLPSSNGVALNPSSPATK